MKNLIWGFILIIGIVLSCCDPIEFRTDIKNNSTDTLVVTVNYQYPENISKIEGDAWVIPGGGENYLSVWQDWDDTKIRQIVIIKIIGDERGEVVGTLDVSYKEYGIKDSYFIYPDDFNSPEEKIELPLTEGIKQQLRHK